MEGVCVLFEALALCGPPAKLIYEPVKGNAAQDPDGLCFSRRRCYSISRLSAQAWRRRKTPHITALARLSLPRGFCFFALPCTKNQNLVCDRRPLTWQSVIKRGSDQAWLFISQVICSATRTAAARLTKWNHFPLEFCFIYLSDKEATKSI